MLTVLVRNGCPYELPNEIWLSILECLDYFTLTKCQRVCKLFKFFSDSQFLDKALFRSDVSYAPAIPRNLVEGWTAPLWKLHPAFDSINCRFKDHSVNAINFQGASGVSHRVQTSISDQFVTSPSSIEVWISFGLPGRGFSILSSVGVTVGDVLKAFADLPGTESFRLWNAERYDLCYWFGLRWGTYYGSPWIAFHEKPYHPPTRVAPDVAPTFSWQIGTADGAHSLAEDDSVSSRFSQLDI